MFGKLNHLAITSDHYTLLGMFYRAMFGLKVSGDTAREIGAISVGDGYVGMTLIPRRGGRKAGLDHFGIEVEDLDKVRGKVAKKYPDIEIVKRPGNRPFASYSAHDPAGNYFDLSQPGHENRAEVYAKGEWKAGSRNHIQPFRHPRPRGGAAGGFLCRPVRARGAQPAVRGRRLSSHRRAHDHGDRAVEDFIIRRRRHRAARHGPHRLPRSDIKAFKPIARWLPRPISSLRRNRSRSMPKAPRGWRC